MARQHVAYNHSRLVAIAELASKSTNLKGVDVACKYVQEEAEIVGASSRSQNHHIQQASDERLRCHLRLESAVICEDDPSGGNLSKGDFAPSVQC